MISSAEPIPPKHIDEGHCSWELSHNDVIFYSERYQPRRCFYRISIFSYFICDLSGEFKIQSSAHGQIVGFLEA